MALKTLFFTNPGVNVSLEGKCMGLFSKSVEQKKKEQEQKLKREQEKSEEALKVLGVDFNSYSDKEIKERNKKDFREIKSRFWAKALSELSVSLQMDSYKNASLLRLSTLVYQNWVLIRQNELILRALDRINNALKGQKTS